jgi:iron(III) transport system substrate-binding protein
VPAASPAAAGAAAASPAATVPANPAGPFLAEDSAEWKAVLEAARREGPVTVYGSPLTGRPIESLGSNFEAQYGFKVLGVLTTSDLPARVQAEQDAGRITASVVSSGSTSMYTVYSQGFLTPLTGLPNGARLHPAGYWYLALMQNQAWPLYYIPLGLLVNRELVPEADQPKNWKDLLDPRWKGKMVMQDPGRSGAGSTWYDGIVNAPGYGEEFHRALAQQDLLLLGTNGEVETMVITGQRMIGVPGNRHALDNHPGAPLRWISPTDGLVITDGGVGVVKDTPSPNAAKVVMNWLLSPEAQGFIAQELRNTPAISGVEHPDGLAIDNLKLLAGPGRSNPVDAQAKQVQARGIYGR